MGVFKTNSKLKIVLHEIATKAWYHHLVLKVDDHISGGYIGLVYLMHKENETNIDTPHSIEGVVLHDKYEAADNMMHHAIGFLHDSHYLTTIDPNFYWKNEPENIEVFMEKELYQPASGAFGVEQDANLAIVGIHKLPDKYDGSINTKDEYINGLLTAMCIDLTCHLYPLTKLITTVWMNY